MTDQAVTELRDGMNRLRGRLFGCVEAMGLPVKQENAAKGLIRVTTYQLQADVEAALRGSD